MWAAERGGRSSSCGCGSDSVGALGESPGRNVLEDRKSTRLNSSHLGISYAVFCLKKKKKQHIEDRRTSYLKIYDNTTVDEVGPEALYTEIDDARETEDLSQVTTQLRTREEYDETDM